MHKVSVHKGMIDICLLCKVNKGLVNDYMF